MYVEVTSREETQALGEALGRRLAAGDLLMLRGELGAGKTTFAQGIGRGMRGRLLLLMFLLLPALLRRVWLVRSRMGRSLWSLALNRCTCVVLKFMVSLWSECNDCPPTGCDCARCACVACP